MPERHLLIVLFWTNLVSNISTIFNTQVVLFWCKEDADLMQILAGIVFLQLLKDLKLNYYTKIQNPFQNQDFN